MIKMAECISVIQNKNYEDLDQEVVFEVTENIRVTKQLKYSKEDMISSLIREVTQLREQIKKIEQKNNIFVQEESLIKLWDNEYDDKWDNC